MSEPRVVRNQIECRHCGDWIVSAHRHDFKMCKCGKVGVDGGTDYLRRLFTARAGDRPHEIDYIERSIFLVEGGRK